MLAIGAGVAGRLFLFSHSHLSSFHADGLRDLAGFMPMERVELTEQPAFFGRVEDDGEGGGFKQYEQNESHVVLLFGCDALYFFV
jgi:hypothetical protein